MPTLAETGKDLIFHLNLYTNHLKRELRVNSEFLLLNGLTLKYMNFATGYAFTSKYLFANFPLKKLLISREDCKRLFNTLDRRAVVIRIFYYSVKVILLDIIENNVTFKLPTQRECYIQMKRVYGEDFKKARRNGKWLDVDYLASNFSGYHLELMYFASERDIHKPIYISKWMRNLITENTNKGLQYYVSIPKTTKDYYDKVSEAFPEVPKKDIERIMNYGWKSVYLHNVYGGDTILKDDSKNKFLFYIGNLTFDSLKHFQYYVKKMIVKIRVLYNRAKTQWDGYYYFALSDNQYQNYLSQQKSKGRKRKYFTFDNTIMLYKIFKECKVAEYNKKYFFKIPTGTDLGYRYLKKDFRTDKAEYLGELESNGFKTINR